MRLTHPQSDMMSLVSSLVTPTQQVAMMIDTERYKYTLVPRPLTAFNVSQETKEVLELVCEGS